MANGLEPDATLETVFPLLMHQREYVVGVRVEMQKCVKLRGNAQVRIGITGTGQKPCYRVSFREEGGELIFGSYWDNHLPLEKLDAINRNWSTRSMDFDEVDSFAKARYSPKKHSL